MTSARPKLLCLVHRFPYPPNRGDRIRSYHFLKALSENFNVYLGTLWDEEPHQEGIDHLRGLCHEVAAYPISGDGRRMRAERWIRAVRSVAVGKTATEGLFESTKLSCHVKDWTDQVSFDAAFVFCSSMLQYLDPALSIPTVVDLVDVDSEKWMDYAKRTKGFKRAVFSLEATRLRELERSIPARASAIALTSESEKSIFQSFARNKISHSIGNGVDLDYFRPRETDLQAHWNQDSETDCVFVGALDYRANVECLEWFCKRCWPEIHSLNPTASFKLVGRNPTAAVKRLDEIAGVTLIGSVADVRPFVWDSAVVVSPLRIARGIQNKVLEAMAMGKPLVASPASIEGIPANPHQHFIPADTPREWIQSVSNLLSDRSRRRSIAVAGRRFVVENHDWSRPQKQLVDRIVQCMATRRNDRVIHRESAKVISRPTVESVPS